MYYFRKLSLPENFVSHLDQTTCGLDSIARGPHQRVMSFVLFGNMKPQFLAGVQTNVALLRELFPGYVMRMYHDRNPVADRDSMKMACDLYCKYPELDICDSHQPSRAVVY